MLAILCLCLCVVFVFVFVFFVIIIILYFQLWWPAAMNAMFAESHKAFAIQICICTAKFDICATPFVFSTLEHRTLNVQCSMFQY